MAVNRHSHQETPRETCCAGAWQSRERIWRDQDSIVPIPIREIITDVVGLSLEEPEEIPAAAARAGSSVPVKLGGYCDRTKGVIGVAQQLPLEVQRFTAAHEVGHWFLHGSTLSFRDLPLKGGERTNKARPTVEQEADAFAAELLMPTKQVRQSFTERFGVSMSVAAIDEDVVFWLAADIDRPVSVQEAIDKGPRFIALLASQATAFRGRRFVSMAQFFGVSKTAMAFRLTELGLVS